MSYQIDSNLFCQQCQDAVKRSENDPDFLLMEIDSCKICVDGLAEQIERMLNNPELRGVAADTLKVAEKHKRTLEILKKKVEVLSKPKLSKMDMWKRQQTERQSKIQRNLDYLKRYQFKFKQLQYNYIKDLEKLESRIK